MAVEHWCKEHKQPFFKKGKMKGYAHPILDDDGEPTGEWCNEPKAEEATKQHPEGEMTKDDWAEKARIERTSIEAQVAYKGIPELVKTLAEYPDNKLARQAEAWAMTRLDGAGKRAVEPTKEVQKPLTEGIIPQTVAELMKWVISHGKQYGPSWACSVLEIKAPTEIADIKVAYEDLKRIASW